MNMSIQLSGVVGAIRGDPELADSTKTQYCRAIDRYTRAGGSLLDPSQLAEYARGASESDRAFLSAAVSRLCDLGRHRMNSMADPNAKNVVELEARMAQVSRKLQSLEGAIKTEKQKGQKAHTWLTEEQVSEIFSVCDDKRDKIVLGLLLSAGLRRSEAVSLEFSDVVEQPGRTVLQVRGKGAKDRVVPISSAFARALDEWFTLMGEGRVLRAQGSDSLSTTSVYNIVRKYGAKIGVPELSPHDCRRTYLMLGYVNQVPLTQLQILAGHESLKTTMRYLNIQLDLDVSASDFVPFN